MLGLYYFLHRQFKFVRNVASSELHAVAYIERSKLSEMLAAGPLTAAGRPQVNIVHLISCLHRALTLAVIGKIPYDIGPPAKLGWFLAK